jgi:hypothetical protein
MYDKFGHILRIDTTVQHDSFFKHYREVQQPKGESVMKFAPMKKRSSVLGAAGKADRRYLQFLSVIDDPSTGIDKLNKSGMVHEKSRSDRGFNFFDQDDKPSFWLWPAGNSPSVACRIKPCVRCSLNSTADGCPES